MYVDRHNQKQHPIFALAGIHAREWKLESSKRSGHYALELNSSNASQLSLHSIAVGVFDSLQFSVSAENPYFLSITIQGSYVAKTILRRTTTKPHLIQVMNSPKVSVIIPAFNAAETLAEAVASVVNGSHKHLEILIVDDCSTDATAKVGARLAKQDSRIKFCRNSQNYGVSKSRNLMIKRATGKYVAFLDSDDTWEPNKLEVCLKMLADNPEVKAVAHALRYLDKRGNKLSYVPTYPTTKAEMQAIKETGESPWVFPSSVVVERFILLKEGGFAEDWLVGEDTELFTKIAQKHGLLATTASRAFEQFW